MSDPTGNTPSHDSRIEMSVSGRVQGVGFRAATAERARRLGLAGWVANTADGRVEIAASGDSKSVHTFRQWLATGPPGARVDRLLDRAASSEPLSAPFTIRG